MRNILNASAFLYEFPSILFTCVCRTVCENESWLKLGAKRRRNVYCISDPNIQQTFRLLFVGACDVQRGRGLLELDGPEVRSLSHLKRTAPGFEPSERPPLRLGLRPTAWSAPELDGLYSHQPKWSTPEIFLVWFKPNKAVLLIIK